MKRKVNQQLTIKPQDVVVLFKLLSIGGAAKTYGELAQQLGMSASEVHASIGRALAARLVVMEAERPMLVRAAFKDFLLHGAKYVFPATSGATARGVPTSYAAPPLNTQLALPNELPPVWPDAEGTTRGISLHPLYPAAPFAARQDGVLYELLALFDALRGGAARERELASKILKERLA